MIKNRLMAMAVTTAIVLPGAAMATNGMFMMGNGTKSNGRAGAGIAIADTAISAADNPAAMVRVGNRVDFGLQIFDPDRDAKITGNTTPGMGGMLNYRGDADEDDPFYIPEMGINYMLSDDMSLGFTVVGTGGMNTNYDHLMMFSGGQYSTTGINLEQVRMLPTLAYKINDQHSVGVSLQVAYQQFSAWGLNNFDNPGFSASPGKVTRKGREDSWGFGLSAGWQGQLTDSLTLGVVYNSKIDMDDFIKWANSTGTHAFFIQTMCDLRIEPRWFPDFVSPEQLKAEFIGRIFIAGHKNVSKIKDLDLHELILGEGSDSILSNSVFPLPYLPGPLEGGIPAPNVAPEFILEEIEEYLGEENLTVDSFRVLINSALLFSLDSHHAQLAAKALRTLKYHLKKVDKKEKLFPILRGLSTVAAVTRSSELANELRILTRRYRHKRGMSLSADESLSIGLVAGAANSELTEWSNFIGEWITEIAFQPLEEIEKKSIHSHIVQMCNIVPELWRTCGRAEAALSARFDE